MNIPKGNSNAMFRFDSADFSGETIAVHFASDLLVAGSYMLLMFVIVQLTDQL